MNRLFKTLAHPAPRAYNGPMTKWMSVTEILQTATASCDFYEFDGSTDQWMHLMQHKSGDTGFWDLVEAIMEEGFREDSPIGFERGEITEGHHRLTAAILLGLDEVPVSCWGGGDWRVDAHFGYNPRNEFILF